MPNPWIGSWRIAIVPAFKTNYDSQPPSDWNDRVMNRVFYDPDPLTGLDRSFQSYIRAASSGRANIAGAIFPSVWSQDDDTVGVAIRSLPANHGYTHILVVLPHSTGMHRWPYALWDMSPVNGITAWARVAMYDDPSLTRPWPIGAWAMEVLHMTTELADLYFVNPNLERYDVMAGASASSHPSAHTKRIFGWLSPETILRHQSGLRDYKLHAVGLPQPPPPDRVTAVQVQARNSINHFLIEARRNVDQYEMSNSTGDGIPREGVIVYEVESPTNVYLRTTRALQTGEFFSDNSAGFEVRVAGEIPGGYAIAVRITPSSACPQILEQIRQKERDLAQETNFWRRNILRLQLSVLHFQARQQGCL